MLTLWKWTILLIALFLADPLYSEPLPLHLLKLPPGFRVSVYAHVPGAREIAVGDKNIVYVGTRTSGKVYALIPTATALQTKIIASNLNEPNGIAFYKGDLYVAEIHQVLRFKDITHHLNHPSYEVINAKLPKDLHHGWRYIRFSPDGWLYIGIGAPCDVCIAKNLYGTIIRMRSDGSDMQIYAKGVRNTVGFDWNPGDQKLWFTDNGVDNLGDNLPPDKLNFAPKSNMNFGFPFYYGKNIPNPQFKKRPPIETMTPSAMDLGPHVASLGMNFFRNEILIAEHGSTHRTRKIGYRITLVKLKNNKAISYSPFITGWLQGEKFWGRPVDIRALNNHTLLISDDFAGVIYQIQLP